MKTRLTIKTEENNEDSKDSLELPSETYIKDEENSKDKKESIDILGGDVFDLLLRNRF